MSLHSIREISTFLNVNRQTVRQYCIEFGEHLSDSAKPPKGHTRKFTEGDRDTLYACKRMLDMGMTYAAVRDQLERGTHRLDDFLPPEEEPPEEETATAIVTIEQLETWVQPFKDAADTWRTIAEERSNEVKELREENRQLRDELKQSRTEHQPWWRRLFGS